MKNDTNKPKGVATPEQNAKLKHTVGGPTTRDATDLGVPMKPVENPAEYVHKGPEDALAPNTRGDYSTRVGDAGYHPTVAVAESHGRHEPATVRVEDQKKNAG